MALFHIFCFWFSMRMGAIIIGIASLIQCAVWLMVSIISLDNLEQVGKIMKDLIENLSIQNTMMQYLADAPKIFMAVLTVYFCVFMVSCALLILGAFKCIHLLVYPFIILDLIYILFLTTLLVFLMLNIKELNYGLGPLILYSNFSGFAILYLLYMWACVLSFVQIIRELLESIQSNSFREKHRILKQNLVKAPNQITVGLFGISHDEED